jgi:MFS family permease
MRPITRETILDRRQPSLRWTAVFAGAAVAIALWVVLQLIGMGAGLTAVDLDDTGSLRNVGMGTTVWSMLAPLIALFVGGLVAGRLSTTFDQKVAASHGLVAWAIASLAGVLAVAWLVSAIAHGAVNMAYGQLPTADDVLIDPSLRAGELSEATDKTGKILLGAGVTLLLSLGAAVGGAALAVRRFTRPRHRTQEVPVVPPPDDPPADAPHVNA